MANYTSSHQGSWHDDQFIKTEVFNKIYPIGSIYMSANSTSPETLFGGTWKQIKDTFLLAAGTTYSAGSTGGAATVTLTEAQMPKHLHKMAFNWTSGGSASSSGGESWAIDMTSGTGDGVGTWPYGTDSGASGFGYTGGSQPHNNMPPYLAVYVWQRTA